MIEQKIKETLGQYVDPLLGTDLMTAKCPHTIIINDDIVTVSIVLGYPFRDQQLSEDLLEILQKAYPNMQFQINLSWEVSARAVNPNIKPLPHIKNIIAVASGKGGVGKSTTAVNLAVALAGEGASVGILDADIHGPNQPQMLGLSDQPTPKTEEGLQPVLSHGIQSMSMGYLIDKATPIVWRGPMITGALLQLLQETNWQPMDYLIIDLPPGTGDIQLTLSQKVPVTGAVIITTPQEVAVLDAMKGVAMFEKVNIPVLGVIENMSHHVCRHCGHEETVFGEGGGQRIAAAYDVSLLGKMPLQQSIREQSDKGVPIVIAEPNSEVAKEYKRIAKKIAAKLSLQPKSYANLFSNIAIEKE